MNSPTTISDMGDLGSAKEQGGIQINLKRVLDRIIRFWYIIVLSLIIALAVAYVINRYSQRIYPVHASIIIRESEENAGAKFLYDNSLINSNRNFFNELYIMKSYPLMQEVVEELGFQVSYFREGEILTTEYYDKDFPVLFRILKGSKMPYGTSMYFEVKDDSSFSLQYVTENNSNEGKEFSSLTFNDTVRVNGFKLFVVRRASTRNIAGRRFVVQFNNPLDRAKFYSNNLNATWAAPGASVVNLDISGPVAQKEIDFLNKFIERYQAYDVEKKNKVATLAMKFLEDQLIITGDSLRMYEDQVERFKNRNVITGLGQETNRLYMKIKDYEDQRFQYRLKENYYSYITKLLKSNQYEGIFTPGSVGITDNIIAGLINEVVSLQNQVSIYKSNRSLEKSAENPLLTTVQQRISFLKDDILQAIDNSRSTEQISLDFISEQIKLVERQLAKLPSSERELVEIQRNYSLKENLYVFLLQKRTEAGLSKASTTSDIVMVNPPLSGGSTQPKVMQNYLVGSAAGLFLPLLVFVLLELANTKIQSKEDIQRITNVPIIGAVGHNSTDDQMIVQNKSRSAMAESFRALRSNLNYFTGNQDHQVFMVTSSLPGEGKSFTTLNLACVYALAGKRTVILGADLRRPKLSDDLKLKNDVGLSQYLSGMASLEQVIQPSNIENLYLIAGGPMPPNPSELLLRPLMSQLIADLRKDFDYIIIDTPPLSFVADAFVLSAYANHTLYVVRQNFTPNLALQSLEEFYQMGKLTNISMLFNDLRKTGLGYGYGGYTYGYGYGYYGYGNSNKGRRNDYYGD